VSGFHPELRSRARLIPRFSFGPRVVRTFRWLNARIPVGRTEIVDLGGVRCCVFRSRVTQGRVPAVVWFHGGGYLMGSPLQDAPACARTAEKLGVVVVAPFYRLAPEHPFPAALDDAYAVLRAVAAMPNVRADRIAVGGMSAGGGLAAALALHARDRDGPRIVHQSLVYPMLDDRTTLRRDVDETYFRLWNCESNRFGWRSYLGVEPGGASVPAGAVPARAESLAGLPSAWIGVGTQDLFHDEDVAYAERLRASGVACKLEIVDGGYHGFDEVSPSANVVRAFRKSRIDALRAALFA
jgi:acetyl esterase/lipase